MIILSYTTIDNYLQSQHTYINKLLGIKPPETPAMAAGKEAHQIIEDHCTGVKKDDRLKELEWNFTDKEKHLRRPWDKDFTLHGYADMINYKNKMLGEIKTSKTPWGQNKFNDLMQWRYYAFVSGFRKILFITCTPELTNLKTFYAEVTNEDIVKTEKWVLEAIIGIKKGMFDGGLDENKKCLGCNYKENCHFL